MSVLAVAGLTAACLLAGDLLLEAASGRDAATAPAASEMAGARPVFAFLAGLLALHLLLRLLDLTPLPWSRGTVALPLALAAAAALLRRRRRRAGGPAPSRPAASPRLGWGDGVAAGSLLLLGAFALGRRIANPDFIYHWGLKAKKAVLAGGTDYAFLERAWNFYVHPDYPDLVPGLFAATALVEGGFSESGQLLWAVVATAFLFLACRRLLGGLGSSPPVAQAALALIALAVTAFSVSWQMTGNADSLVALAVVAAALCLTAEASPATDLRAGLAAAFAAAVKIEGVAFAAFFLALYGAGLVRRRHLGPGSAARLLVPPALVVLPWWLRVRQHGLAQGYYSGDFGLDRLRTALDSAWTISLEDGWHGISLVALALLAGLLPAWRPARPFALLCALQLGFTGFAYATAPADTELLVRSSFPRLMLHLVPAILVFSAAALERWEGGRLRGGATP